MRPLEVRRRARVVASFAEYLAEDADDDPDRTLEATASLAEWCGGDSELLARARTEVLRDTPRAQVAAMKHVRALELLELVARDSRPS
jgi:hypothetical protein